MSKEAPIYSIVVGTAGHIDHGKSSIVRHLTGVDPDRLAEEKARGLTIDLGFAPLTLESGRKVGLIDVPGHERFIKNMVAGATGIDLVVLVVAADDSVMPQTREHLDIMTLLGVERGVICVNKIDLVEEDLVDLVEEEIRETVAGTFLEEAPLHRVSAVTGAGMEAFKQGLEAMIDEVPERQADGIFRVPIQRVFSAKGHGTVVTGVPVAGSVKVGDRLEVLPLGSTGRVRALQAYGATVEEARAGHSTAINLSDLDFHDVHRGMVAAEPGYFRATDMIEARVRILAHLKQPLLHQTSIRFHTGTVEVVGQVYLLEGKAVEPGAETFAQFRLSEPIVVAPGDRYVFRLESPMMTLGGGEVLDRSSWRLKMGKGHVLESLRRKESALGSKEDFVASIIQEAPFQLVDPKELSHHAGFALEEVKALLGDLESRGVIRSLGSNRGWLPKEGIELGRKRVLNAIEAAYEKDPYRVNVSKLEVRDGARLQEEFFAALVEVLDDAGDIRALRGGKLVLPGREIQLSEPEQKAYDLITRSHEEQLFAPPRLEEMAEKSGQDARLLEKVQALLVDQGKLVRINADVILLEMALDEAESRLRRLFADEGAFSASRAKDVLETSRRFAIPILEHLDRMKRTRRVGDVREVVEKP